MQGLRRAPPRAGFRSAVDDGRSVGIEALREALGLGACPFKPAIQSDVRTWPGCSIRSRLLGFTAAKQADAAGDHFPDRSSLFGRISRAAHSPRQRYAEAEPLFHRALAIGEASHGPDHTSVARKPQSNLAGLLGETGRLRRGRAAHIAARPEINAAQLWGRIIALWGSGSAMFSGSC